MIHLESFEQRRSMYKELLENQTSVRKKLFAMIQKNPQSMRKISKEMGIGINTLIRFLDDADVEFSPLNKIIKWMKENE